MLLKKFFLAALFVQASSSLDAATLGGTSVKDEHTREPIEAASEKTLLGIKNGTFRQNLPVFIQDAQIRGDEKIVYSYNIIQNTLNKCRRSFSLWGNILQDNGDRFMGAGGAYTCDEVDDASITILVKLDDAYKPVGIVVERNAIYTVAVPSEN